VLQIRAIAAAAMVLAIASSPSSADEVDVHVENFFVERGISTVVLKITNNTSAVVPNVFVSCAFLDANQKAIDIGKAWVTNLGPNKSTYDKARIPSADGVQFASCSVD